MPRSAKPLASLSAQLQWTLDQHQATLSDASFVAHLDLHDLRRGLHRLRDAGCGPAATCLAIEVGPHETLPPPNDVYLRSRSLSASFPTLPRGNWQLHVDWRLPAPPPLAVRVVDLVFSLQTDLLEAYPQLTLRTALPERSVTCWSPAASAPDALVRSGGPPGEGAPIAAASWPSPAEEETYLEMVAPGDFAALPPLGPEPIGPERSGVWAGWQHRGQFQEKGVIRCLRLRALWMAGLPDDRSVSALFNDFCTQTPPLTT